MSNTASNRLASLDILRGFDMFFIMGSPIIFKALANITQCEPFIWWHEQMKHCEWDGFAIMDLVFPLFLFIAGISFPLSYDKRKNSNNFSKGYIYKHILKRVALLFLFGILYNGCLDRLSFSEIRYGSVLGRIGIAWGIAAAIFMNTNRIARISIFTAILLVYWLIMALFKAPDAPLDATNFSSEGNIAGYLDRILLPGRLYKPGLYEAEGILSTLPSIATALMGMFLGEFMLCKKENLTPAKKVVYILIAGAICILIGQLWNVILPINKILWSSSFVLFAGGISLILFALFYWVFDIKQKFNTFGLFFMVIGVNSIFIYLIQRIVKFNDIAQFFIKGLCSYLPDDWRLLMLGITRVTLCWLLLYYLYKKKTFLKI